MKPFLSLIALLFGMAGLAFAQGDDPGCNFCYQARDYTCDGATNCATTTFTAPCDVDVYFRCEIGCGNSIDPTHCRVTAKITQAGVATPLKTCQNWDEERCLIAYDAGNIHLQYNVQYTVTVCLESCGPQDCCGNCRAVASVYTKYATCSAP
jgi:hypothetical protein